MPSTSDCHVTIIVVNWNGKHLITDTLYALQLQTYRRFHTVVVDNGSSDGSASYIRNRFPAVEIISLGYNSGFAYANNIALKRVQTQFVALLNNDAVPAPHWLEHLAKALGENHLAGFAASKMLYYDNPALIDRAGDAYTNAGVAKLRGRKRPASSFNRKEWIFGACAGAAMYKTNALKDVGYFDEDFFLINEDVDLSFRLQSKNYRCLYVPEAVVFHKASSSIVHDSPTSVYYGHRNLEWVYLKNLPGILILVTLPLHFIYNLFSFFYFIKKKHGMTYLRAKRDAFVHFKTILKKRKMIQSTRVVTPQYLWQYFEREAFIDRLRIRKNVIQQRSINKTKET